VLLGAVLVLLLGHTALVAARRPVNDTHPTHVPAVTWPLRGQAAFVLGSGRPGSSPHQQPVPIASLAKVMTAYLTLKHYPLRGAQDGFTITVTADQAQAVAEDAAESQSVVALAPGEQLTEVARLPPGDALPRSRQIVSMPNVTLPVAGTLTNFNPLLAEGYAGKTGSDSAAAGCLAFFTHVMVGGRRLTAVGVVLGQGQGSDTSALLAAAGEAAQQLVGSRHTTDINALTIRRRTHDWKTTAVGRHGPGRHGHLGGGVRFERTYRQQQHQQRRREHPHRQRRQEHRQRQQQDRLQA
jgi:hypothetical protein